MKICLFCLTCSSDLGSIRTRAEKVEDGWRIHGEGQALNPGIEGQSVRVRTESGRIVSGVAVAERQVEVAL